MAQNVLAFTIYELLLSTAFGLLTIYLGQKFLCKFILRTTLRENFEKKNIPLSLFSGSLLLCLMILTRASILPSVSFLQVKASGPQGLSFSFFLMAFLYFLLFYVVSFLSALFLLFLSSKIVLLSTQDIDEIKEIKEGNIPAAIIVSLVMISFSLYTKPSLEHFLSGIVNFLTSP